MKSALVAADRQKARRQRWLTAGVDERPFPRQRHKPRLSTRQRCRCPNPSTARSRWRMPIRQARPSVMKMSSALLQRPLTTSCQSSTGPTCARPSCSKSVVPRRGRRLLVRPSEAA
eukprot:809612-Lingulodinium_polyedra.AAC.1